jgi:hypothetical protein
MLAFQVGTLAVCHKSFQGSSEQGLLACAAQIFVQVAFYGARPGMDPATPEPLRRLIRKCWDKVAPQLSLPRSSCMALSAW